MGHTTCLVWVVSGCCKNPLEDQALVAGTKTMSHLVILDMYGCCINACFWELFISIRQERKRTQRMKKIKNGRKIKNTERDRQTCREMREKETQVETSPNRKQFKLTLTLT
jgi:hypothetical protein